MLIKPPVRKQDAHGAGYYGAPRGSRKHRGIDLACYAGSLVVNIAHGEITKYGYPYSDSAFRYVEVTNDDDLKFRYFYVEINPELEVGDRVKPGDTLGMVQNLTTRYPGITQHLHFEVKNGDIYLDPLRFLA